MKIINRKLLIGVDFDHLESHANELVTGRVATGSIRPAELMIHGSKPLIDAVCEQMNKRSKHSYFVSNAYSGWSLSVS
jgi:hypothetical protein